MQGFALENPMPKTQDRIAPGGRAAVLDLVKREGPVASETMAAKLGITSMAVRQHLAALEDDGLVEGETQPSARGRPAKLWHTTARSIGLFPDAHAQLAGDLIGQMKKAFGGEGLDRLLKLRTAEQLRIYREAMTGKESLKAKLEALAAIRSREGYMAEVRREPETGAWLLVENHCPICAAARLCAGLCREELSLFHKLLGRDVSVERVSHILAGAGRCAYRVIEDA
jgi:predicted ArsR family transcriptional regulator